MKERKGNKMKSRWIKNLLLGFICIVALTGCSCTDQKSKIQKMKKLYGDKIEILQIADFEDKFLVKTANNNFLFIDIDSSDQGNGVETEQDLTFWIRNKDLMDQIESLEAKAEKDQKGYAAEKQRAVTAETSLEESAVLVSEYRKRVSELEGKMETQKGKLKEASTLLKDMSALFEME